MNEQLDKENLYSSFYPKVERYVKSRVKNAGDTEDIISDIFEKALRAFDSYDSKKASLSTWMYTITRNTVLDYYRRHGRVVPFSEITGEIEQDVSADGLIKEEELGELAGALAQLPQRQQDIIILRFYCEIPQKEIAERMNISYANVRYLQFTALRSLKKILGGEKLKGGQGRNNNG